VPGRGVFVRRSDAGARVLFAVSGALVDEALVGSDACASAGVAADVYHLRFIKPLDTAAFVQMALGYSFVVIAEEGVLTGSASMELAAALNVAAATRAPAGRTIAVARGYDEKPLAQARRDELLERAGLSAMALAELALSLLASASGSKVEEARAKTSQGRVGSGA
ncbi:MAG: hypothetical protein JXM71_04940, partial [Spirochaetales bacterium]|nr:hypothetical protein [Spirochaetales bacterium]